MKQVKSRLTAVSVLVATVFLASSRASLANSSYFPNQPANQGDNATEDVDFAASSIPVGQTGALSGLKYWVLDLATYDAKTQCFNITTSGTGGDTRIWIYDNSINDYRSLNDDSNGTYYSEVNIWIAPPSNGGRYVSPVISSYSPAYNSMQFKVQIKKRPAATTESACTNGATYKSTNSGNTFVNAS